MTYDEALDFIYSRRKFQKSAGHERIERLLELMDNPHKKLRFIHVVGTNGKGSVCTAIASVLQSAGYITGLFTSPFVTEFGERIRVNGEYIPKSAVASITKLMKEKIDIMEKEGLYPTVFELTTVLGMCYFCDMNCDAVVLEAGIGGGKDSTNVISAPVVAVITSVSLDHTEVLGESAQEIAREKCGIIKGSCPVVSYPFENGGYDYIAQNESAAGVIKQICNEKGNELIVPDGKKVKPIKSDLSGTEFCYDGLHLKSRLCGSFQIANIITAVEASRALSRQGYLINDENIKSGIESFFIPGRLECVSEKPAVLLDAGHNEGAIDELVKNIKLYAKGKTVTALCAFMKDKDYKKAVEKLAACCNKMIFTNVDEIRGEKPEELMKAAKAYCKECFCEADAKNAFSMALSQTDEDGFVLVCGSFYLVSEIRKNYF